MLLEEKLDRIIELLTEVVALLKTQPDQADNQFFVDINESRGDCPECGSVAVNLYQHAGGLNVYECKSCKYTWTNDGEKLTNYVNQKQFSSN